MASHVVELFPGGIGVAGATILSPVGLERTDQFNSVQIEIIPLGTASGIFSVVDSGSADTGFAATTDSAGNVGTVTAYTKVRVTGVADFVRVQANVSAGSFRVRATLVNVPNATTVSATVSGTIAIDQTTPGTTNLVQVGGSLPAGTNALGQVTEVAATHQATLSFTSPTAAGTVAQAPVVGLGPYKTMSLYAQLTGATGGTLDIYLQYSPDGGTTWVDWGHFAQIAAGAAAINRALGFAKDVQQLTAQTVGTGTSPALAAGTFVGGDWGDRLRVVAVAGAGTSAGAAQVLLLTLTS